MKLRHFGENGASKAISSLWKWARKGFALLEPAAKPAVFNAEGAIIRQDNVLEEEAHPRFLEGVFYPVKIGEVFLKRYQVVGKLGWGISCTVWLAHDLK